MLLNKNNINTLDQRYRAHFINSLSGFKSANIIGTSDDSKHSNLAIFTSVFHLGAHPPLLGLVVRPHTVARHTLENILLTEHYTINHVNSSIYKQAHQTSARYDKNISEFAATNLTEEYHNDFPAPFVEQSRIQLGMEFRDQLPVSINNTLIIIGEITLINIKDDIIDKQGRINIESANSVVTSGLDRYHSTELLACLEYAKPD